MFERPQSGERAILVHAGPSGAPDESEREEFAELARSAGAIVVDEIVSAGGGLFWTGIEIANFNYVLDMAGNAPGGHTREGTTTGAGAPAYHDGYLYVPYSLDTGDKVLATFDASDLSFVEVRTPAGRPMLGINFLHGDPEGSMWLASTIGFLVAWPLNWPMVRARLKTGAM